MHHIVSDGWSMGVLIRELSALYGAFLRGAADPLPELPVQYADYAVWQRQWLEGEVLEQQAAYWKRRWPARRRCWSCRRTSRARRSRTYAGALRWSWCWPKQLTAGLKELSRRHGHDPVHDAAGGLGGLLARLSGQDDVVIGTPMANRQRRGDRGLIGFFVNTLALRLDLSGRPR